MRFNTVEVAHAYSDYLDSLDDWPPPEDVSTEQRHQASPPDSDTHDDARGRPRYASN